MSATYQPGSSHASSSHAGAGQGNITNQVNPGQVGAEYGTVMVDPITRNGVSQAGTEYGALTLDLNQNALERHIGEAKIQLNIARDQLRTLTKANKELIAGNVTSHVATGSVTIGGVFYAVIESKLDFGAKLGRVYFNGNLGGLPIGVNGYSGGAEFFLPPDQLAALGPVDIQVNATPVQCFICWRHNTRILGAFYGTGSGASGFGAIGNGAFKQIG